MLRWQLADSQRGADAAAAEANERLAAECAAREQAEGELEMLAAQQDRMAHALSSCQQRLSAAKSKELHLTSWAKSLAAERDQAAANAEQLHRSLVELQGQHALSEKQAAEALRASQQQHEQEMQCASATFFDGLHRAHATISHLRGQLAEAEREALAGFQAVESLLACNDSGADNTTKLGGSTGSSATADNIKFGSGDGTTTAHPRRCQSTPPTAQHTPEQLVSADSMVAPATPPAHMQHQLSGGNPFPRAPRLAHRSFGSFVQRDMAEAEADGAPDTFRTPDGSSVDDSNPSSDESGGSAGDTSSGSSSGGEMQQAGGGDGVYGWLEGGCRKSIRDWFASTQ